MSRVRAGRRAVLAAALGGGLQMACAGGTSGPAANLPPKPAALRSGAKIAFLNDANQAGTPLVEQVLDNWKRAQPGVAVDWIRPSGTVSLTSMVAAGTPPDVFAVDQNGFAPFAASGETLGLDDYVKRDKLDLSDHYPASLEMCRWQGKQHGLPRAFNCGVLYTNLSHFDQVGLARPPEQWGAPRWGWDEFKEAVRRVSQQGAEPKQSRYGADLLGGIGFFWAFAYSNGGELFNPEMTATRINEAPVVAALQLIVDLIHRQLGNPTPDVKQALGDRDIFFKGQATMQLIGASNVNLYQQIDQFPWDWRPLPGAKAGARNWGGGNSIAIAARSPAREEAWAFFQHLTSSASTAIMATQYFPARRTSLQQFLDAEAKSGRPPQNRRMILDAMQNARVRPNHARFGDVQKVLDEELGVLWSKGGSVQTAVDAAKRRIDPILQGK